MIDQSLLITDPTSLIKRQIARSNSGYFASVYRTHDSNTMLKVRDGDADGWLLWAFNCFLHEFSFDWMPEIHQMHIIVDGEDVAYRALMKRYVHAKKTIGYRKRDGKLVPEKDKVEGYRQIPDGILQEIMGTYNMFTVITGQHPDFDLHSKNWMIRYEDDQEIITDPWWTNRMPTYQVVDFINRQQDPKLTLEIKNPPLTKAERQKRYEKILEDLKIDPM